MKRKSSALFKTSYFYLIKAEKNFRFETLYVSMQVKLCKRREQITSITVTRSVIGREILKVGSDYDGIISKGGLKMRLKQNLILVTCFAVVNKINECGKIYYVYGILRLICRYISFLSQANYAFAIPSSSWVIVL